MAKTHTSFRRGQGGRKPGAPNLVTKNLREFICEFLSNNREKLQKDFDQLKPGDRLYMFERFLKYALPALHATSLDMSFETMTDMELDEIVRRLLKNYNE